MIVLAASCFFLGAGIGLRFDIRIVIMTSITVLAGALAAALTGVVPSMNAIFGALAVVAALQTGYVSIVILDALGIVRTMEAVAPRPVRQPSASDSPSRR